MLGDNIMRAREKAGMTACELAQHVGMTQPHLCRVEKGHAYPTVLLLCAISDVLGVSVDDLLGRSEARR